MEHTTFGVDLSKTVFQIAESDSPGRVAREYRVSRSRFSTFFAKRPSSTIVMEACGSAHHWGRHLASQGHEVVLLPPHAVRPYITRNKTDRADAKGILEAFRNKAIRPVPLKSIAQQGLTALHRFRSCWVAARTARINTIRGVLRELGILIPLGARKVVPAVFAALEDGDSGVPDALRPTLASACKEIGELNERIRAVERELEALAGQTPRVAQLRTIPGIGLMTSTAVAGVVGDLRRFPSGRHFASYLGITPRESSSAKTRRLGRISKRGDTYIRMLLVHGARAILWQSKKKGQLPEDRLRTWALEREGARGHNKTVVALANKLARIIWAVWTRGTEYCPAKPA